MKKYVISFLLMVIFVGFWYGYPKKSIRFSIEELQMFQSDIQPLLDVIAKGEGDYTSVNRGRAGDTPSSWPKENLGKDITEMTVAELRSHQGGADSYCWYKGKKGEANLYAVGRYQLIPCTLMGATWRITNFDMNALYDAKLQNILGVYLIIIKRPIIRGYLAGLHDDHVLAGQELAKEFASVPIQYANTRCQRGQSYYCNDKAGNAAHISLEDIDAGLRTVRDNIMKKNDLRNLIESREDIRETIKRFF